MSKQELDEILTEILVIKDIYICGRMNQAICSAVVKNSLKPKYSRNNWDRYEELSNAYRDDSIGELLARRDELLVNIEENGLLTVDLILGSSYKDFDDDLMNEMMKDFYGGKDTIAFATCYSEYAEDFNAILSEYL